MRLKNMNTNSTKATEWPKMNTNIYNNTLDIHLERKHSSWFWDNSSFKLTTCPIFCSPWPQTSCNFLSNVCFHWQCSSSQGSFNYWHLTSLFPIMQLCTFHALNLFTAAITFCDHTSEFLSLACRPPQADGSLPKRFSSTLSARPPLCWSWKRENNPNSLQTWLLDVAV